MGTTYDYFCRINYEIPLIEFIFEEDYEETTAFATGENDWNRRSITKSFDSFDSFLIYVKNNPDCEYIKYVRLSCDLVFHEIENTKLFEQNVNRLRQISQWLSINVNDEKPWTKNKKNHIKFLVKQLANILT